MLILVSKTSFVSMCTLLIAIRFGTSAQLVRSGLLSCYGGGGMEEVTEEREGGRRWRTRQANKHRRQTKNTIAISQATAGTVDSKQEKPVGSTMVTRQEPSEGGDRKLREAHFETSSDGARKVQGRPPPFTHLQFTSCSSLLTFYSPSLRVGCW